MKAKTVKMCDMPIRIALVVFEELNRGKIEVQNLKIFTKRVIVTDEEPDKLCYPEGWYYAKGYFRNKHTSTTGCYSEVRMIKTTGESWEESAKYCTLYD